MALLLGAGLVPIYYLCRQTQHYWQQWPRQALAGYIRLSLGTVGLQYPYEFLRACLAVTSHHSKVCKSSLLSLCGPFNLGAGSEMAPCSWSRPESLLRLTALPLTLDAGVRATCCLGRHDIPTGIRAPMLHVGLHCTAECTIPDP